MTVKFKIPEAHVEWGVPKEDIYVHEKSFPKAQKESDPLDPGPTKTGPTKAYSPGIVGKVGIISKNGKGKEEVLEDTQEKMWAPPLTVMDMHTVVVSGGMTINLGNYESAKIQVSLSIPCSKDSINDAYEFASDWVSDRIESAVKKAKGE